MNSNSAVRKAVRLAMSVGAVTALAVPAAFAQDAQSGTPAQANSVNTTELGKIEVTGTRILRSSTETAQPITVITAKQIKESGLTTIGDVIANITQASSASNVLDNGSGRSEIDLRYFGAGRVLVLVNGRRWTPDIGGIVDLNNIPASVVDHVEILQDGASAIYGSDAITGVVNIITVKNFNGADANAYMGMYDNNYGGVNGWDGKTQAYDFTIGSSGPKAGVVMNIAYTENNPVFQGARVQTQEPTWTQGGGSSADAAGRFIIQQPASLGTSIGSATCSPVHHTTDVKCDMGLINTPTDDPTLDNFRNFERSDEYNYAPTNYFMMPLEVTSIFLQGHYDMADNLTFTSMAEFNNRSSQSAIAPTNIALGATGDTLFMGSPFGIGANNPYNPFHKDLVANASQYCPDGTEMGGVAQTCTPNLMLTSLSRRNMGGGLRESNQDVNNYTIRMGLNGFFNAMGNEWDWDLGSSYGKTAELERETGNIDSSALSAALDAPGATQCNGPGQATQPSGQYVQVGGLYYPITLKGCVPVNLFGGFNQEGNRGGVTGEGSITPQMFAYYSTERHFVEQMNMHDYTANITGDIAQLPAGPVGVAAGGEYLEVDGFNHPDPLEISGNTNGGAEVATQGRTRTDAEYIEFNVPLVANVPLVKSLSLDLANRWSQFKWAGGNPGDSDFGVQHNANATTGQAKLRWQVTEDLLLRGSWSQGFRAPSLSDLYSGLAHGAVDLHDPCAPVDEYGDVPPGGTLPAGCHGLAHTQVNKQIFTTEGGNPNLTPERAISRSAGFVYDPSWIPGFDISADYYKIDLNNAIGSNGSQYVLDQCYISNDPDFCAKIQTTSGGSIVTDVLNVNANTGETYSRGVDVSAHYRFPATAIGNFTLGTNWTFVQSFVEVEASTESPTGWESSEQRGYVNIPQRKGNLSLNWNLGNWSARWYVQYIGKMFENCSGKTIEMNECSEPNAIYTVGQRNSQGKNQLGTTIYHDVEATYHVDAINTNFTFGIRNLFNKQFPVALEHDNFVASTYRLPGRFFYAQVGVKF